MRRCAALVSMSLRRLRSTRDAGITCVGTSPERACSTMLRRSLAVNYEQPDLFPSGESSAEDGPARTSLWLDAARAWVAHARGCSGRSCGWPTNCPHAGSFSRTSPVYCRPSALAPATTPVLVQDGLFGADDGASSTGSGPSSRTSSTPLKAVSASEDAWSGTEGQWVPSSGRWSDSGMAFAGECWTLSTSESPSDVIASSLPDVLETGPHLSKYFLSPKAAAGIMRRARRRGRELPEPLRLALEAVASAESDSQGTR